MTAPVYDQHTLLISILEDWQQLLRQAAQNGALRSAAQQALRLVDQPHALAELVAALSAADFEALPPVRLLPASAMPNAVGAYADRTGTIVLNQEWLASARRDQVLAVLSEELGHHLDGLLNASDTPGDEGELFATLLTAAGPLSDSQRQALLAENDQGSIVLDGQELAVERAAQPVSTPIHPASPGRSSGEFRNLYSFAALKADGSVVTWGSPSYGGDSSSVAQQLSSGVSQIFSNQTAFAALKADGSVVTWGRDYSGGDSRAVASQLRSEVIRIFSTGFACAALKSDGSVVTWGQASGGGDSSAVAQQLRSGVSQLFSTTKAFAALKADGSVITWGSHLSGGDSSAVASQLSSGVNQICSTYDAFAALKADGSVVTWGSHLSGGDSSAVSSQLSSGVSKIFATEDAFAALKADGSVISWGAPASSDYGGDNSAVASQLSSGVSEIFSTKSAFAALKTDGSVVTWGWSSIGGDSGAVASELRSGVSKIFTSSYAFAALKADGSVISWGSNLPGGINDAVASQLRSGVNQIAATQYAFAALKTDGSVVTWAVMPYGNYGGDSSAVANQLRSGVSQIFATYDAFAALKADGSVVTWGNNLSGGDSSAVASQLNNVVAFANPFADDRLVDVGYTAGPTTLNGVNLGSTIMGYAVQAGDAAPLQVTYPNGDASANNPGKGWAALAAAPTTKGFALYWQNASKHQVARWQLNAKGEYQSGYYLAGNLLLSEEASLGFDLNADGYTPGPTSIQGVNLGRTAQGYALQPGNGTPLPVSKDGLRSSESNPGPGWDAVAATPSGDGYSLYWRHAASQQVQRWTLNASGAYNSGANLSDAEITSAETNLNFDLNGDGYVAVSLFYQDRYALISAGAAPKPIKDIMHDELSPSWGGWSVGFRPAAITPSGSGYNLYVININTPETLRWQLDSSGAFVSGGPISASQLASDEANLKRDLNGDGFISGPSTIADLTLGTTSQGYALRKGDGAPVQVSWPGGNASANSPGHGWVATAAVPTRVGSTLYWQNSASGQWARWELDPRGNYNWGRFLSSDQLYSDETSLNADLNGDAIIGAAFTTLENQGNTSLLRRSDGLAFVGTSGYRFSVRSPFNLGTEDPSGEWQMLAAESVGGQSQILWRNNPGNFLHLWTLDPFWNWQSSSGNFAPSSAAALGLESNFQLDLNGNGVIG